MKKNYKSPFKPKISKDGKPTNFKIFTFNSGFKKKLDDLLIVVFDKIVPVSAIYSKTSTPSAPIIWDKKYNKGYCKVLIVNSGNANAHTGLQGVNAINKYTEVIKNILRCKKSEIFVSSTGVIGEQIEPSKIINKLPLIEGRKSTGILNAAKAIMTTDTFPKTAFQSINFKSFKIKIYGFAKGSGMIAPNMGTMLSYIFIEAPLNKRELNLLLKKNAVSTFNSITVDGDTSTSDTTALFAINSEKLKIKKNISFFNKLSLGLNKLMLNLAKQIVSDGEGISKLIEIEVLEARSFKQASNVAFSIANSLLVKTAIAGEDANWGRIVMAIGKSDQKIQQNKLIIKFGNLIVAKNGKKNQNINISKLNRLMKNRKIEIKVILGVGKFSRKVWSSDLTHEYVSINADYRS